MHGTDGCGQVMQDVRGEADRKYFESIMLTERESDTVVVVPTYNNAGTLSDVLHGILEYIPDVIVVNDGSTDSTSEVLGGFGDSVTVIAHERNMGKGNALKTGLKAAKEKGWRYAITIDSDGQHFPSDIPLFLDEIRKTPDALLVGARDIAADNMPGKNTFANRFSNFWYRLETGNALTDTQSGFRLYPLRKTDFSGWWYTGKYEFELEAIVFASWNGTVVRNIPVKVHYQPPEERISHFRPFRDFSRISVLNTLLVLVCLLWICPRNFFRSLSRKNIASFYRKHIANATDSNLKITAAVMLGVFMGIVPIWGYQMIAAAAIAHMLKLNKVITLVASNVSIPPMIPFILYGSYYTGCRILGRPVILLPGEISLENTVRVLEQYVVGSFVFAAVCALAAGAVSGLLLFIFRRRR